MESLKLLKASSTTTSETKKNNTTSSESNSTTQSESGSTASTDGNSDSNQNGQYVYDSNGNAVYIYQDSDGNWVDSSGAIYYFNANGITNSNGASFTYNRRVETATIITTTAEITITAVITTITTAELLRPAVSMTIREI